MSTASLRLRGLAALVVLVLFPFFVLFLAIALLMGGIWVAEHVSGNLGGHVALLIFPLLLAVLSAVRDIIKARKPPPVPGDELKREDHPALWSELDALANAMQQPRPDRVVVLPTVNAFVTTAAGHREVMIGYPLLAGLSRAQLRAVLAHEMGHLAHGHTRTGGLAYRAGGLLEHTLGRLDNGLLHFIVAAYYRFYLLISMSVLRDHERQADEWSARLAGGPESASVFPALARLGAVWSVLCDSYLPLAGQVKARPDLREAIERLTESNQTQLDAAVAHQLALSPSRWSTHPADSERMQRLQTAPALSAQAPKMVAAGQVSTSTNEFEAAWHLLGRQQPWVPLDQNLAAAALRQIEAGLMSPEAAPASWAQIVQTSQLEDVRNHVELLLDQFRRQAPGRRASVRELLTALADSGPALLTPLLRGDLPPERRDTIVQQAVTEAARAAILLTVADQGRGRSVLRWDAPAQWQFLQSDRNAVPWPDELSPAEPLTRAEAGRLLDLLTRNGINVDAALGIESEAKPTTNRTLQSITAGAVVGAMIRPYPAGTDRRTMYDVLVMDDGLLFSRIGRKELGFVNMMKVQAGAGSLGRDGVARVQQLSHNVDGDPQSWAANPSTESFWVPFTTVRSATLRKPRGGFRPKRITLELPDRAPVSIRWTMYTFEVEQVDSVLRAALHGRLR
jgi:Zn-dependent protease with chaperone function